MASITTTPDSLQSKAETAVQLFDGWFDPIETAVRERVRGFIKMNREFIAHSTKMPRSTARLSTSALSNHSLSSAAFIINIAESDFRHTQVL